MDVEDRFVGSMLGLAPAGALAGSAALPHGTLMRLEAADGIERTARALFRACP